MICTVRAKIQLLALLLLSSASAQNFYVDKNASGNSDGSSWVDAWTSIEDSSAANPGGIDWSVVSEGDTIFISGGMDSTTYDGTLTVNAAGSRGNNLVITKGLSIGHNGKVIIDGGSNNNTVDFDKDADYVTLSYLTFKGSTDDSGNDQGQISMVGLYDGSYGSYIQTNPIQGVIVENCEHYISHNQGVHMKSTRDVIIRNCLMITTSNDSAQTDGIYSQIGYSNIFDGNSIYINNNNLYPHCDGIQMNQDSNIVVRNNYIEQNNSKDRNAQGIYATECFGTIEFYNNVINMTTAKSNAIVWRKFDIGNGDVIINSNTIYGEGTVSVQNTHGIWVTDPNNIPVIKNNIIQWVDNAAIGIFVSGSGYDSTNSNIQNNVLSLKGTNSISSDPLFTDPSSDDFTLHPYSPAIDNGDILNDPYDLDIDGIIRPQFGGYDIGAHENINRLPVLELILNQNMNEGNSLEVSLAATDPDGDNITLAVENLPEFTTFNDNGDGTGTITFEPDYNQSGVYPDIMAIASDDGISPPVLSDTVTFTLTVNNINRAPVIEPIANQNMNEGDSLEVILIATDSDGGNLILTVENLPSFGTFNDNSEGTGIITFAPAVGDSDVYFNIRVIANDDGLLPLVDTTSFTLTVNIEAIIDPDNLSASALVANEVELSWMDNSNNEDGFIIEREIPQTEEYQVIESVGSNVSNYIDTSVIDGQKYNYRVEAFNKFIESGYAGPINIVTLLPAPSSLIAKVFNSPWAVQLDWIDNSDNESGFVITKKDTTISIFVEYDTVGANITTYTDNNISSSSDYLYKVYAFSIDTVSDCSNTADVTVPVELVSFTATVIGNSVSILWRTVSELNNKGFEIERMLDTHWEKLAFVAGKGTTLEVINYQYCDDFNYTSVKGIVQYRLKQIDFNGTYKFSDVVQVNADFSPNEFVLYQNYPNPFNPSTKIKFALPDRQRVKLTVYNTIGEVVAVLVDEVQEEGFHDIQFNAAKYKSGVYFYNLQVGDPSLGIGQGFEETKKMILLR